MRLSFIIIGLNILAFILQGIFGDSLTLLFSLVPAQAMSGALWQFITYMFMHGGFWHITINMFVLLIFGTVVERELGWRKFLALYFISGVGSALLYLGLTWVLTPAYLLPQVALIPMLGASGAVFGILTGYAFRFPRNWIIMFPGIPIPAALLVVLFAIIELFSGLFGLDPGTANFGHLGGILFGFLLMLYWRYNKKKDKTTFEGFEWVWD
jgi:membrane associated rhomboid family serine protease